MRPSALASSGVSPLFSVLLTAWPCVPKVGKIQIIKQKKMQTIRSGNYTRLSAEKHLLCMLNLIQSCYVLSYSSSEIQSNTLRQIKGTINYPATPKSQANSHLSFDI